MNHPTLSVSVTPVHTLEAVCLARLCESGGVRCVDATDGDSSLLVVALPRGRAYSHDELARHASGMRRVMLVAPAGDPKALALGQVINADATVTWRLSSAKMLTAIRSAANGDPIRREETDGLPSDPLSRLTSRERDVMELVAHGHSDSKIADRLGISAYTVHTHVQHALAKLEVTHRHAAAALVRTNSVTPVRPAVVPPQRKGVRSP